MLALLGQIWCKLHSKWSEGPLKDEKKARRVNVLFARGLLVSEFVNPWEKGQHHLHKLRHINAFE